MANEEVMLQHFRGLPNGSHQLCKTCPPKPPNFWQRLLGLKNEPTIAYVGWLHVKYDGEDLELMYTSSVDSHNLLTQGFAITIDAKGPKYFMVTALRLHMRWKRNSPFRAYQNDKYRHEMVEKLSWLYEHSGGNSNG